MREVYEETGVEGRVERKLGDVRYVYTWEGERIFKVVSFFLLRPLRGQARRPAAGNGDRGRRGAVAAARRSAPAPARYGGEREMAERALEALAELPL